ncbi:MAG: response regulator transcription factor [Candidatus Eremiobacteraeota bacterium]|nr:response regulator transcription factor [Candidatus Eremiobacteraeota bacterium]
MRILIVEDDPRLADVVRRGLEESGHVVDVERDGEAGAASAEHGAYDAIVLDVMLPRRDGYDVARRARAAGVATPILMLTARDATEDVVAGIAAGADDYLRKPFAFAEFEARLHAITRRKAEPLVDELRVGELVMDLRARSVRRGARTVELTARETAFLEYFMRNTGRLLTRAMLEDALWERDRDTMSNVVDVYVRRLRAKLSAAGEAPLIETVRGMGYRLRTDAGR